MKTSQIYPGIHDDFCGGWEPDLSDDD